MLDAWKSFFDVATLRFDTVIYVRPRCAEDINGKGCEQKDKIIVDERRFDDLNAKIEDNLKGDALTGRAKVLCMSPYDLYRGFG